MGTARSLQKLLSEKQIQKKVSYLARQLSRDYAGKDVLLVGVLKGAFIFMADLARRMTIPVKMDFVRLASYGVATRSSGKIRFTKDLEMPVRGKDVLVVEDIIDTGISLHSLYRRLRARSPKSLKVIALLDKPKRRKVSFHPDYLGFSIDDHFVVGYGLDCAEEYRHLRGIYFIRENCNSTRARTK
jgi:hypoxanthine phosphoribosyltransferase